MRTSLPRVLVHPLEARLTRLLYPAGTSPDDFLRPAGEAALIDASSVSWRVFRSPLAVFVGGVAAVVLELAEPRVRSGVWDHTSFRERPLERLQRTGHAAMMSVYGPRSTAEAMIARVNRRHAAISGATPSGQAYRASDPALLAWVHATASFGFLQAHRQLVLELPSAQRDAFYAEGEPVARRYGVAAPPCSEADVERLFEAMRPRLEASPVVHEFLHIARGLPLLPWALRPLQPALVGAAVGCVPEWARERLGLDGPRWRLAAWQWALLRAVAGAAARLPLAAHPATLAARRLAGAAA